MLSLLLALQLSCAAQDSVGTMWQNIRAGTSASRASAAGCKVDAQGNVIVAGSAGTPSRIYVAKHASASGALLWESLSPENANANAAASLATDAAGNIIVTGMSGGFYTVKFSPAGAFLWERRITDTGPGSKVVIDSQGNAIVLCTPPTHGWRVVKLAAATGAILWQKDQLSSFNNGDNSIYSARDIAVDSAGNVIVAGRYEGDYLSYNGEWLTSSGETVKYAAADGARLWARSSGPDEEDRYYNDGGFCNRVITDSANNIYVAGNGDDYAFVVKHAANGDVLWTRTSKLRFEDVAGELLIDADGHVVVAGCTDAGTGGWRLFVGKCHSGSGAILWGSEIQHDAGGSVAPQVLRAPNGNLVLAHHSGYGAEINPATGAITRAVTLGSVSSDMGIGVDSLGYIAVAGTDGFSAVVSKFGVVYSGYFTGRVVLPGPPGISNIGTLDLTVAGTGAVTGKLTFGKKSFTFTGAYGYEGALRFDADATPYVLEIPDTFAQALALSVVAGPDGELTGIITRQGASGLEEGDITGARMLYDRWSNVPAPMLNFPVNREQKTKGIYHLAFPARNQPAPLDAAGYPQGAGFATLTLRKSGAITLAGTLGDGTRFSAGTTLRGDSSASFFASLHRGAGAFTGDLQFADLPDSDITGTNLAWARPTLGKAPAIYPQGWPAGILVDAVGTQWIPTPDLGQGDPDPVNGNVQLKFTAGFIESPLGRMMSLSPLNGAVIVPLASKGTTLSVSRASGLFRGAFKHPLDQRSTAYQGILLNKGSNRGGYGFFIKKPAATSGNWAQSGNVTLAQPQ